MKNSQETTASLIQEDIKETICFNKVSFIQEMQGLLNIHKSADVINYMNKPKENTTLLYYYMQKKPLTNSTPLHDKSPGEIKYKGHT